MTFETALLVALIEATCARFPDYPPYGDPNREPVPHCTVGANEEPDPLERILAELRTELGQLLPIACRAAAVLLYRERDNGSWVEHAAYPLLGHA